MPDPTNDIKAILQELLNNTPNIPATADTRARINNLLGQKRLVKRPFIHTMITPVAGLAGTPVPLACNVPDDFLIQAGTYFADIGQATQTNSTRIVPLATINLTIANTSAAFSDAAVPITSLFGTSGDEPFIWPEPQFLPANTNLAATLTNFSTAPSTYNIRLMFHGVKLFSQ